MSPTYKINLVQQVIEPSDVLEIIGREFNPKDTTFCQRAREQVLARERENRPYTLEELVISGRAYWTWLKTPGAASGTVMDVYRDLDYLLRVVFEDLHAQLSQFGARIDVGRMIWSWPTIVAHIHIKAEQLRLQRSAE